MNQIRLSIERFWVEPGNFELWCEILSRIPPSTQARSIKEVAAQYLNKENDRRLDRSKELFGLNSFKYSKRSNILEIKGVCYLYREGDYFKLTEEAKNLIDAYKQGESWEVLLAKQLLQFSPRTRALLHVLLNGGFIETNGYNLEKLGRWTLIDQDQSFIPFASNPNVNSMNALLMKYKWESLGPYWSEVIQKEDIQLDRSWMFIGSGGNEPAKTNLTHFMRCPIELLYYLEWLQETTVGKIQVNIEKMKEDLGRIDMFTLDESHEEELSWLKHKILSEADDRGFFPVEIVFKELKDIYYPTWDKGLDRFVDYYLTNRQSKGLVAIVDHESGQPRHGRGYLGKREYQLIKLEIHH